MMRFAIGLIVLAVPIVPARAEEKGKAVDRQATAWSCACRRRRRTWAWRSSSRAATRSTRPSPSRSRWPSRGPRRATSAAAGSCWSARRGRRADRLRLPRDRPGRGDARHVRQDARTGTTTRPSACPAPSAGWRWPTRSSASCRGRTSSMPAVQLADEGFAARRAAGQVAQRRRWRTQGEQRRVPPRLRQGRGRHAWKAGDRLVQKDLGEDAAADRREGAGRVLHGRAGRPARRGDEGRRRAHHRRRTWRRTRRRSASRSTAPIAATTSTARRRRAPAASRLVEMLNILENFDLEEARAGTRPRRSHLMTEAMRRAYRRSGPVPRRSGLRQDPRPS